MNLFELFMNFLDSLCEALATETTYFYFFQFEKLAGCVAKLLNSFHSVHKTIKSCKDKVFLEVPVLHFLIFFEIRRAFDLVLLKVLLLKFGFVFT